MAKQGIPENKLDQMSSELKIILGVKLILDQLPEDKFGDMSSQWLVQAKGAVDGILLLKGQ